jgi:hypothetical protein
MNVLVLSLLVEELLIKSFHEGIDRRVSILQASNQILSLPNASFLDWRIYLNVCQGKIGLECLVKSFLSEGNTDQIVAAAPLVIGSHFNASYLAVLGADYLYEDCFINVLIQDLEWRLHVAALGGF